jgi:hypothetical protein
VSDPPNFDELIGPDLPPGDRERLRRVHELLVAAGPPAEMPELPASPPVRTRPRRRVAALLIAAALAVAAFVAGWLVGGFDSDFDVRAAVAMHGTAAAPAASGTIELGYGDDEGNWPMVVEVSGLEPLPKGGYYELLLTKNGEPVVACGSFNVGDDGYANVRLGASYNLRNFDGWVVRPWVRGRDELNKTVVLTT